MGGIPKGGFTKREELELWLLSQPEANIKPFALVLAHRSEMRALPTMHRNFLRTNKIRSDHFALTLATFRVNIISSVACIYPTNEIIAAARKADEVIARSSSVTRAASATSAASPSSAAYRAAQIVNSTIVSFANKNTSVALWKAVTLDVSMLENGGSVEQLHATQIWIDSRPSSWLEAKSMLETTLASTNSTSRINLNKWSIWLDWYNSKGQGYPAFDLPAAVADKLEMRIALGDGRRNFWGGQPDEINAEIADWVEAERELLRPVIEPVPMQAPEIPAQAIAPLETIIVDNQVVVHASRLAHSPTGTSSIHKILRAEAADLAYRLRGQMPDAANLMDACRENLAADVQNIDVYGVDYFWGALREVSSRADEQLLEDAAGRLSGFILNLENFLKQFPEWVAYHRQADLNAFKVDPKLENINTGKSIAIEIAKHPDTVSIGVSIYLGKLTLALSEGHTQNPETAYGFLRSLANVLQSIGSIALGSEWIKGYKKQLHEESTKWAARTTLALGGEAARVLLGNVAGELMGFSLSYPYMFGWVGPLFKYLGILN